MGTGSFYRSKHELVFVFQVGRAPHVNTIELGHGGRYRTNVWDYAGVNTFRTQRLDELAMHPTVKPVALVCDAIKDCSRRGEIVLDPFAGSGTTIIAAEKSARRARTIEIDPAYVDVCIRRWQNFTGRPAPCRDRPMLRRNRHEAISAVAAIGRTTFPLGGTSMKTIKQKSPQ
jgi:hypothetical protein